MRYSIPVNDWGTQKYSGFVLLTSHANVDRTPNRPLGLL